jgi:hypothetical protein
VLVMCRLVELLLRVVEVRPERERPDRHATAMIASSALPRIQRLWRR